MASGKRITQVSDTLLLRAGDLPRPSTQASAKLVRPLICCLKDDATAFTAHQDFALGSEPAFLWKPDRLTAAVLEELRTSSFHSVSLDLCLYMVKLRVPALVRRTLTLTGRGERMRACGPVERVVRCLTGASAVEPQGRSALHYRRSLRARRTPRPIRTILDSQFRICSNKGFRENHTAMALPATATSMLIGTPVT